MTKIKGFALLGRATSEQLRNYKLYYRKYVDFKIEPICEIHKYLRKLIDTEIEELTGLDQEAVARKQQEISYFEELLEKANGLEREIRMLEFGDKTFVDKFIRWSKNREYIAYWEIDRKDLPEVAKLWIDYKDIKIKEMREALKRSGDTWDPDNKYPECNGDDED